MTQLAALGLIPQWTLGDRLRKAREASGMSQTEFADATEISRRSISKYELDEVMPKRPQLLAWAFATGVSLEWLIEGECAVRDSNPEPADYCLEHAA